MTDLPRRWSRRLVNALLAGAASWPGLALARPKASPDAGVELSARLLGLFPDRARVAAIGAACLDALPANERSVAQLIDAIAAAAGCDAAMSEAALRAQLADRVRQDFATGAVISVDGWLLSATEARLYALAMLTNRAGV
jgi:hypothetical protein